MNHYRRLARDLAMAESDADLRRAQEQAKRLMGDDAAKRARVRVKKAPALAKKASERQSRAAARASTRAECVERDGGCAVDYLGGCRGALHHDHFFGRGRFPPDAKKEWMLCAEHDHQKTTNMPNRKQWLWRFLNHATSCGYQDVADMCAKQLAIEIAQHPEVTP